MCVSRVGAKFKFPNTEVAKRGRHSLCKFRQYVTLVVDQLATPIGAQCMPRRMVVHACICTIGQTRIAFQVRAFLGPAAWVVGYTPHQYAVASIINDAALAIADGEVPPPPRTHHATRRVVMRGFVIAGGRAGCTVGPLRRL